MKLYRRRSSNILTIATLACITLTVWLIMVISCGKLSDDNSPSSPVGTSGGVPIPIEPRSSLGTHTLSIAADPATIPADGVNYSTITVTLQDASGRSVSGFTVNFTSDPIGFFREDTIVPLDTTTTTAITDASGQASVRFYGNYSGYCAIKANVDLDENGINDLFVTTAITLTSAGLPSSAGNYTLTLEAYPDTIPADMATYSIISATLTDSTGGSVENFEITFMSELGYLTNSPTGPSDITDQSTTPSVTNKTNKYGSASVYFYGRRAGSAIITASVTVDDLYAPLQAKKVIHITEGAGPPGDDTIAGVDLVVDATGQHADLGACSQPSAQTKTFTLTATVWDETGDKVGPGVRVELSGTGIDESLEYIGETNATGSVSFTYNYTVYSPGTYEYSATARVIINGREYTDTVYYTITATCVMSTPTPTPAPAPTPTPTVP